jgi:CTP:molybdopterin cytidylyltransferase MocA
MLAVAILAGGESRRMGSPKALLDYHGKTFVEHLIDATRHPRVGVLRVVLGAKAEEIRAQLPFVDPASVVINQNWPTGQLSSIRAAILSLPTAETEGLMLCPVDHPMISQAAVSQLIAAFDSTQKSVVLPIYEGRRGHPVIFRASLYEELLKASPEVGARQVVWAHADELAEVLTEDKGVTLNIDDPASYRNVFGKSTME